MEGMEIGRVHVSNRERGGKGGRGYEGNGDREGKGGR